MSYQLDRLTGIATHNGWEARPLTHVNGESGGLIASRGGKEVTIFTDRRGHIINVQHTDHPNTRFLSGRADRAAEWLVEEVEGS